MNSLVAIFLPSPVNFAVMLKRVDLMMMKKCLLLLPDTMTALVLGIVLTFAFAPYDVFPLAVICCSGLLALWMKTPTSTRRAFWIGYSFGLGLFGTGVYWVFISIHVIADVPIFLAALITIGMILFLAIYPGLVGYFIQRYFPNNNSIKLIYAFPAIWLFSEWLRNFLFTGFPWLYLGYSQTNSPLKGYAPILGVFGVSLAVSISSALLLNAYCKFKQYDYSATYRNVLSLLMIWLVGGLLSLIPWTQPQGKPISVALVQGNIAQTLKWLPEHLQSSFDRYTQLTESLWGKYQLIIWPESAIPIPVQQATSFITMMNNKASTTHSSLVLGIPIKAPEPLSGYFNAISVLPREGTEGNVYLKRRLVPFGEYTPFSRLLADAFNFMNLPMSEMLPGNFDQAPLIIDHIKILPSICYEIAFPELIRTRDDTIGLLLTLTNDAWFGHSNAQAQHLQMAAMRALELRRPVLFVSNDGITAIIGANGKVLSALPPRKIAVLTGTVQPMQGMTPWMYNGMDPVLFIGLCLLYAGILFNKKATRISKIATKLTATQKN